MQAFLAVQSEGKSRENRAKIEQMRGTEVSGLVIEGAWKRHGKVN